MARSVNRNPNIKSGMPSELFDIFLGCDVGSVDEVKFALVADPESLNRGHPSNGMRPLHVAAADGNLEIVQFLLDQPGIDCFAADRKGLLAVDWARQLGNTEIRSILLDRMNLQSPFTGPSLP